MTHIAITCPGASADQFDRAGAAARATVERLGVDPLDAAAGFAAHERWDRAGFPADAEPGQYDREMMAAYFEIEAGARASLEAEGLSHRDVEQMTMDLLRDTRRTG